MNKVLKHRHLYKSLILVVIFILLTFSIVKNLVEIAAVSSHRQTICVPILMYHQVKNSNFGKDTISPYEFENDLKYLSENKYNTITMTELIDYVYNDGELPDNPVILSFDDGNLSTYKFVFPLLKEYDMKIVLSIVGKATDDFTKVPGNNIGYAQVTWNQVYEMEQSGHVEIQNHTYNLHKIKNGRYGCYQKEDETSSQYEELLENDILTLQEKINDVTGTTPNTFTYPYGKYNNSTENIIKELGFKASLSCTFGVNLISKDNPDRLFGLKRICRAHNQDIETMIEEGLETLKFLND